MQKRNQKDKSFRLRATNTKAKSRELIKVVSRGAVGEKKLSLAPAKKGKKGMVFDKGTGGGRHGNKDKNWKNRRSASGNVFRSM
jgi:ribosome biogenesis protein ENP2